MKAAEDRAEKAEAKVAELQAAAEEAVAKKEPRRVAGSGMCY